MASTIKGNCGGTGASGFTVTLYQPSTNTSQTAVCDSNGNYTLSNVSAGVYVLSALAKDGVNTYRQKKTIVADGAATYSDVNFSLVAQSSSNS